MTEAHECNAHCYPPAKEKDNMLRVDDHRINCVHCRKENLIKVVQFITPCKLAAHVVAMMPNGEWEHEQ